MMRPVRVLLALCVAVMALPVWLLSIGLDMVFTWVAGDTEWL